jgi:hypothetical protein
MTDDERLEQIKRDIGWHATGGDCLAVIILILALWALVTLP